MPTQFHEPTTSDNVQQNKSSMEGKENKSDVNINGSKLNTAAGGCNANHNDNRAQNDSNILSSADILQTHRNVGAIRQYKNEKRSSSVHGNMYQLKLLMLFLKRGVSRKYSFRLGTEIKQAGKFDDLVFQYTQDNEKVYRLLQAKHKLDGSKTITAENLLGSYRGDYSLIKYFLSYEETKKKKLFKDGTIKDATICTNIDFDFKSLESAQIKVQKVETSDDILDVKGMSKEAARYKFAADVAPMLERTLGSTTHSLDEIHDFLHHLVFAVNQPNEDELGAIIKQEIGEEFDIASTENIYNKLLVEMLDWLQGKQGGRFLSSSEGIEFFEKARGGIPISYNIKTPVTSFTGRKKELYALHKMLQLESGIPRTACICGFGGVGKSELVRKYICLYGENYGKKIMWINADSYESLAASFRRLASDKLNISTKTVNDKEKEIRSIVEDVYQFFAKQRCLFVFDNAEKYKGQKDFDGLLEFLPALSSGGKTLYVLITSRNKKWPEQFKQLHLNVFDESEATDFLKNTLSIRNNTQMSDITNLAVMLGFMPLALQQAVSYINVHNRNMKNLELEFTIQDYIKAYDEKTKEYLEFDFSEHCDSTYTETVFKTWNVTLKMMRQMEHGSNALEILNITSYMAAEDIPTRFFSTLFVDLHHFAAAIGLLSQYSLIKNENGKFNIHRLIQQVIRMNLREQNREPHILKKALELLTQTGVITELVLHAVSVWNHLQKYTDLVVEFCGLSTCISTELLCSDRYGEAHLFGENMLEKLTMNELLEKYAKVSHRVTEAYLFIAHVLIRQTKYDIALKALQEVLNIPKSFGFNASYIRQAKLKIADIMLEQFKHNEALRYYKESCASEHILGTNHFEILHAKHGIAKVFMAKGKHIQASRILKKLCNIQELLLGKNHPITLNIKASFATTLTYQKQFDKSLELFLEIYNVVLKISDSPFDRLSTVVRIASVYTAKKDYNKAMQWLNDGINAAEFGCAKNHPCVLFARAKVADILGKQGKYKEGLELCWAIFEKLNSLLGSEHPWTLNAQCTLGEIYVEHGNYTKTIEIFQEVLRKMKKIYEDDSIPVLNTLKFIANVLRKQKKFDEALQHFPQILDIEVKIVGENNINTLRTKIQIGVLLCYKTSYEQALKIFRDTLDIMKRFYPHHSNGDIVMGILTVKDNVSSIYVVQNKPNNVLKKLWEVLQVQEAILGKNHTETVETKECIAELLFRKKKATKAQKLVLEEHVACDEISRLLNLSTLNTVVPTEILPALKNDLFTAVQNNGMVNLRALFNSGGNVNSTDNDGRSLLHYAVNNDNIGMVGFLLENGVDVMQVTKKGTTPLHIAVYKGLYNIAEVLLQHAKRNKLTALVDAQTTASGSSALHMAAINSSLEIVKLLLTNGATYNIKDKESNVPIILSKNQTIVELLELTDDLFQNAKSGNIAIIRKLRRLSYDRLLALCNARSEGKTILQVGIANNQRNFAKMVVQTLQEAHNPSSHR